MADTLSCTNSDCTENGIDKDPGGMTKEQMEEWGMVPMCGGCGKPCEWATAEEEPAK